MHLEQVIELTSRFRRSYQSYYYLLYLLGIFSQEVLFLYIEIILLILQSSRFALEGIKFVLNKNTNGNKGLSNWLPRYWMLRHVVWFSNKSCGSCKTQPFYLLKWVWAKLNNTLHGHLLIICSLLCRLCWLYVVFALCQWQFWSEQNWVSYIVLSRLMVHTLS